MNNHSPKTKIENLLIAVLAMVTVCFSMTGCSMCCGTFDYHYPTFGGRLQRANPEYGRVGSVFSDPYATSIGPSADSNLQPIEFVESTNIEDESNELDPSELDGLDDPLEGFDDPLDGLDESIKGINGIDTIPDSKLPGPSREAITPREATPTPTPDADASTNEARRWRNRPARRSQQRWR